MLDLLPIHIFCAPEVAHFRNHRKSLFKNIIHNIPPLTQMYRLPVSVVILNLLINPPEKRGHLRRIVAGVPHDRVDGVPETVWHKPPVSGLDRRPFQRRFEALEPSAFADSLPVVIAEKEIIRLQVAGELH